MNAGELEHEFRLTIQDLTIPYLFSKEEVYRFANEALIEACRRARLLVSTDATNPVCVINVQPGISVYPISNKIIQIKSYRYRSSTKNKRLELLDYRYMDSRFQNWEDQVGEPTAVIVGLNTNIVTLYKKPIEVATVVMTAVYLPSTKLLDYTDEIPIPEHLHDKLVYWMLYKAYKKNDTEVKFEKLASLNLSYFVDEFGTAEFANSRYENYKVNTTDENYGSH